LELDLLITDGNVVDGTGKPVFLADIGIEEDRIVWVHHSSTSDSRPPAAKVIDAKGLTVTPGFIDSHSHSDVTVLRDPEYDAKIRQGVTTDVIGICGFSLAPVDRTTLPLFDRYLSAIAAGHSVRYEWESFGEYLRVLRRAPLPTNVAPLVGHGTVRMAVMGFDRRPPDPIELKRMVDKVREAMEVGARGLSSGLVYPPGAYATAGELLALLEPVAEANGIYSTHIRSESHAVEEAIAEAITTARKAGVPLVISHLKAMGAGNWGKVDGILHQIDEARSAGQKVIFDQYPYAACSTLLNALVPPWAHESGMPQLLKKLKSPAGRAEIIHAVETIDDGTWQNFVLDAGGWSGVIACTVPWGQEYEGKSFAEIAGMTGESPGDIMANLLIELEGGGAVVAHTMSDENVVKIMRHPAHIVGSDGSPCEGKPHPRLYGTFIRVLTHYARDRRVLSLEEAVAKMTGRTASFYGLRERGIIAEGRRADLVIFDYETLKDNATYADPRRHPDGIKAVILNGQVVVKDGQRLDGRVGRVLSKREE
jgi:N-acyl-D-aspartate/D-glutamate deacylase